MADEKDQAPAPDWASFQPPELPEKQKLDEVVRKLKLATPQQIVEMSVATGVHSAIGHALTEQYVKLDEH